MGTGPGSHPASSQSQGPGRGLPTGPDTNHWWSYRWPADHLLSGQGCAGCSRMPQWESQGLWGWPPAWLTPLLSDVCPKYWALIEPGHHQQGICINVSLPCSIVQLKIIIGKAFHQVMTCSIQLCCSQDVCQRIVVSIDVKSWSIKVFMKFLYHSPLEDKKLQFVGGVMVLSLGQTPTGIGNDGISQSSWFW